MAATLEARLRSEKDIFSRTAIHLSVARRLAFNKIAKAVTNKKYDSAKEQIMTEYQAGMYSKIASSLSSFTEKANKIVDEIGQLGPVFKIVVGLVLVAVGGQIAGALGIVILLIGIVIALTGAAGVVGQAIKRLRAQ
ncbi:MAG TPA: hypothetical protein VGO06_28515 [Bosea sp. (in: a-proteobacteria)]|uniref:hypothetical protein n=1 Tax=Bosea sp. (in: a-proteobacteria) TaxID=1871050 RepID=UPI002E123EBC|nr:hypothetical protein [Bosea sp. (in: a-proteobacteria)]